MDDKDTLKKYLQTMSNDLTHRVAEGLELTTYSKDYPEQLDIIRAEISNFIRSKESKFMEFYDLRKRVEG